MQQTLQSLVGILIEAIPTALFLVFLHFYLRWMLFGPLRKVLRERDEMTAGARKAAEASLITAEQKVQEYEAKLRDARAEVYKEQEEARRRWLVDQGTQVSQARIQTEAAVKQAKFEIAQEAAAARTTLLESSSGLAEEIASSILIRRHNEARSN
jgi:F-type H+-transporting ATPase subunit b